MSNWIVYDSAMGNRAEYAPSIPEHKDISFYSLNINTNWIGVVIAVLAAIVSNLGVQIQKQSHIEDKELPKSEHVPYSNRKRWLFGLFLVIIGAVGDFEALSFTTQALVASVGGGTTVITNAFFSMALHKEQLSRKDMLGTSSIILGVVIIAWFSPRDKLYTLEQLLSQFAKLKIFAFFVFLAILVAIFLLLIREQKIRPITTTQWLAMHDHVRLLEPPEESETPKKSMVPYYYAAISGIVGSVSVLLGKCASEMVRLTIQGENQFKYVSTYIFFLGMFTCVVLQTDWLNKAIVDGDISSVFPVFQVFWIAFGVFGGAVFYDETSDLTTLQEFGFIIALLCVLVGVYLLAQHVPAEKHVDTKEGYQPFSQTHDLHCESNSGGPYYIPPTLPEAADLSIGSTSRRPMASKKGPSVLI